MLKVDQHEKHLREIAFCLCDIAKTLRQLIPPKPTSLQISQGGFMITGVPVGGSGTFVESFVPSNSALPAGAVLSVTWTVDDPLVTLAPSADGTSVVASVAASDTATSFNLTATGTSAALPGPITSGPVNVPILPAPPPLPTSLAVNQTA
jgi:hypothetical protein